MAEILIIHYNGLGPEKVERNWHIPMLDGYIIKIAYPAFVDRHYRIGYAKTFLSHRDSGKKHRFDNYLVEDIGAIAKLNLENRMGRIKIKAIARATSKYLMTKTLARVARKESGELAGVLVQMTGNLASIATEQADLRQWRLLPDDIRVGRALVAPGHYNGRIDFFDSKGGVVFSKAIDNFQVKGGEKKFLIYRTIS